MRDSYVNAFLIQSRGVLIPTPCDKCQRQMTMDRDAYAAPFPVCIRLPGHFGGCCGNCKWRDHAARCSERDDLAGNVRRRQPRDSPPPPPRTVAALPAASGSAEDPIDLDEEGTEDTPIVLD
jgi:hypothetical protein